MVVRRQFVAALDGRIGTYVTCGERLMEVVATRQLLPTREGFKIDGPDAGVLLVDCARPLRADVIEEIASGVWIGVEEAEGLDVVEPMREDGAQ